MESEGWGGWRGGTWHAGSRRISTISWAPLNATLFLAARHLFFFSSSDPPRWLIGVGQNPNPPSPPTELLPKFFYQLPRANNCRRAAPMVPKCQCFFATFPCALLFQTKLGVIYIVFLSFVVERHRWLGLNKPDKRHLRKFAGGAGGWKGVLEISAHSEAFVWKPHLFCQWQKVSRAKQMHQARKRKRPARTQATIQHASLLACCSAPMTNSKHWCGHNSLEPAHADSKMEKSGLWNKESRVVNGCSPVGHRSNQRRG